MCPRTGELGQQYAPRIRRTHMSRRPVCRQLVAVGSGKLVAVGAGKQLIQPPVTLEIALGAAQSMAVEAGLDLTPDVALEAAQVVLEAALGATGRPPAKR